MVTVEVPDHGLLVLDARTLFVRLKHECPLFVVKWKADAIDEKHIDLICAKKKSKSFYTLNNVFKKNFVYKRDEDFVDDFEGAFC